MMVMIEAKCMACGQSEDTTVDEKDMNRYSDNDGYVQTVFPEHTPAQREIIISNHPRNVNNPFSGFMCSDCWAQIGDPG
tara:strand:+ start:565 stop:801 length:237 start_codon:yes stop_codon:yes gene_type:complete